jgi:serine/threonine protein kinase/Flp pilus assembly protein TadD
MVGQLLAHYTIREKIGAGGMGVVYRAHDEQLGRDVAIKVLPSEVLADDAARKRFRKEALALAKLNHPNIETVHEFGSDEGLDFLVTEYVPGVTLDAKLAAGTLSERQVLSLGIQLAEGLEAAHEEGVVHRDLKPANLRVRPDGRLKILDFGLATLLPHGEAPEETVSVGDRNLGAGTLPYMAPEQLRGETIESRADIWAAGVVLYEMATGRRPFDKELSTALTAEIINEPPPPPARFRPGLPRRLEDAILKCLEKDPDNRYQSAKELAVDLRRLATPSLVATEPRQARRHPWLSSVIATLALLSIFAVLFILNVGGLRERLVRPASAPPANIVSSSPVRSLAVLPLENLSSNSEDYFADGMTDELITDLAQISALRVISRTSVMPYKGARKPLPQIARELNVDAVVEGTVLRSGKQVRITAQLIQAPADKHLWAQSYEGDVRDTLALQKKVARAIAEQIRIKLTPQEEAALQNVKAVNPEAYENYLKGRYFWNKRTADSVKKAIYYFNQAIESDPNYSLPYAGLADIYQMSDHSQLAREEVQKALDLDDQSAEAHNSLARLLYLFNRDWDGAEREFRRALELDHNYAPAHHWYSMYLALEGRKEQALAEAEKAYELDPLSPVVGANLARILREAGQNDKAIEQAKKTLDLEPDSAVTHAVLGIAYQDKGMYAEAITEFKRALQLGGPPGEMRGLLGYAYAASGNRTDAERIIAELKALWPGDTHAALDLAVVFSGLGDKENTLYWLEKAQKMHVSDLIGIGQDSHFVEVRRDRRFQALVQRVGAPK